MKFREFDQSVCLKWVSQNGYPRFLNLGAEGTRGFGQKPLAASAAPIQESVLPMGSAVLRMPQLDLWLFAGKPARFSFRYFPHSRVALPFVLCRKLNRDKLVLVVNRVAINAQHLY